MPSPGASGAPALTPATDAQATGAPSEPGPASGPTVEISTRPAMRRQPGWATLAALGDLMLAGEWDEAVRREEGAGALGALQAAYAGDDLVFANLEVTLAGNEGVIPKQPRIVGAPETLRIGLSALGVDVVSLANNHAFDSYLSGFGGVRELLEESGVLHLGAGSNEAEAARPLIVERQGIRFGWLAYAARDTRPSHVARAAAYGVNPLEEETVVADVRRLHAAVDHVLVSLHWGVEYCHLPAPDQVAMARRFIAAGASLILGHHAHVVQGVEAYRDGAIVYNLGNALATDLGIDGRLAIRQTRRSRSSLVLRAAFSQRRLEAVELVPFRCSGSTVEVGDPYARRLVERANRRLAAGITPAGWRAVRLYEDVVVRTLKKLHPRVVGSVRLRHVRTLFSNLARALQGRGPA